jgi:hypothetical protein
MKKLKLLLALLTIFVNLAFAATAAADFNPLCGVIDPTTGQCTGACKGNATDSPLCKQAQSQGTTNPVSGPSGIINKAVNIIALAAGAGAVIMILIGAFEFVTAGGTGFKAAPGAAPTKAAKARARISSALVGLAVIALAWAIVRLITDQVIK